MSRSPSLLALLVVGCACVPVADDGTPPIDVERGPKVIPIDGDANGLALLADGTLILADDNNNRLLKYTDADGISVFAELPTAPERGPGLGQVAVTPDGRFVIPRFGFGSAGDVVVVEPDGTSFAVTGLNPARRRIGVAASSDGKVFIAGFFVEGGGARVGSVWELNLDTGEETTVMSGMSKPVGVIVVDDTVYVSDQDNREIIKAPKNALSQTSIHVTNLPSVDLLSAGPDGSLFTGGKDGQVLRIKADGSFEIFADGRQEVRGTVYDAVNRRLFVADHDGDEADGVTHNLVILPVDD